ncbi:MAG: efflux transporter outer membrane subunit [Bacteroidales bacterium]|nr:efflux transporter outer membrane subunit [Bacteroidales bacterium]
MDVNSYKQVVLDQQKEKSEIILTDLISRRGEVYFDLNSSLIGYKVNSMKNLLLLPILLLLLSSCMVGKKYQPPQPAVPENYRAANAKTDTTALPNWWTLFNDPVLDALIQKALANNPDMLIAASRIEEARLTLGNVKASFLPSFGYNISAATSDVGIEARKVGASIDGNVFKGYGMMNWEIDLWGKIRRSKKSALADLLSQEENRNALRISLIAQVAMLYFQLQDFDTRLSIATQTFQNRKESAALIAERFEKGYVSEVDKLQAEQQEALAEVMIPNFTRAIAQTENAIHILCGSLPDAVERGKNNQEHSAAPSIPVGLPSQLLQRRPDIRSSEATLHAQCERIGIAQASMYPSLSLTGLLGLASPDLNMLLKNDAFYASGIGGLTGPLFQFGQNRRRVSIERTRTEVAMQNYQKTVLNAFREVNDALTAYHTYKQECEIRQKQSEAARKALQLTYALYDHGYSSYIEVMMQENNLFDAELQASATLQQQLSAYIQLYKALGGGFF